VYLSLSFFLSLTLSLSLSLSPSLKFTDSSSLHLVWEKWCSLSFFLSLSWSFFLVLKVHLNGSFETRTGPISSSRNSRRERDLYLVLESSRREVFGNHFPENFGNWWEMTGKLWCLVPTHPKFAVFVSFSKETWFLLPLQSLAY
jgi:hypothetical protein